MMADKAQSVIERLRQQLTEQGKIRGFKKPKYQLVGRGQKELIGYDRQHVKVVSADIIELCELACGNGHDDDPIVQAQTKGHQFAVAKGNDGTAVMLADDVFYLLDLASSKIVLGTSGKML